MQLFGLKDAEIAKRVDIAADAIFHGVTADEISDLDLSYAPPLGSPRDGVQAWVFETRPRCIRKGAQQAGELSGPKVLKVLPTGDD